tara:strand:- start:175 stop:405 length:231 start_codon:yes stop_codon:yes gene_type:complete
MKTLSLKLDDSIFGETEKIISQIKKSRNKYINEAVEFYNKYQRNKLIEEILKYESKMTQKDSLSILKEFEDLEYED